MDTYALILRNIATRTGRPALKEISAKPLVKAAFRVTIYRPVQMEVVDSVSTLVATANEVMLETVHAGRFNHQPILHQLDRADYRTFVQALSKLHFDKLPDQPLLPVFNASLCLVERGAGTFIKDLIFSPERATGDYARLLDVMGQFLPEVFHEVK